MKDLELKLQEPKERRANGEINSIERDLLDQEHEEYIDIEVYHDVQANFIELEGENVTFELNFA